MPGSQVKRNHAICAMKMDARGLLLEFEWQHDIPQCGTRTFWIVGVAIGDGAAAS